MTREQIFKSLSCIPDEVWEKYRFLMSTEGESLFCNIPFMGFFDIAQIELVWLNSQNLRIYFNKLHLVFSLHDDPVQLYMV